MPQNYPENFSSNTSKREPSSRSSPPVTESSIIYLVRTVNDLRKQRY